MGDRLTPEFLSLFCEKNSNGTKYLRLKGKELEQRIGTRLTTPYDMIKVANFMSDHPEITYLNVCYNNFGDYGIKAFAENYFSEPNNLRMLNLMHCDITAKGMQWLTDSPQLNVTSIRLNGNKIGTEGARFIGKLIQTCQNLEHLEISEMDQTLDSISSILMSMERSKLKILDISRVIPNNYYLRYDSSNLADDLAILMKMNSNLTQLLIQKCEFDGHDVELLLSGLSASDSLLLLDIGSNNIGDHGTELIAHWLKKRPKLTGLNISANGVKNYGLRALSYGLPHSRVRFLDISNNRVGDLGMTDLLHTAKKYVMLRMLHFWGNKFGVKTNRVVHRLLQAKVLEQEFIDVKIYFVDDVPQAAYYPDSMHLKRIYYCAMQYGHPPELKIEHNFIPDKYSQPRALFQFANLIRYPPVDRSLPIKVPKVKICPESKETLSTKEVESEETNEEDDDE